MQLLTFVEGSRVVDYDHYLLINPIKEKRMNTLNQSVFTHVTRGGTRAFKIPYVNGESNSNTYSRCYLETGQVTNVRNENLRNILLEEKKEKRRKSP